MKKKAFTTLELIVVLGVLAIFMGFVVLRAPVSQVHNDLNAHAEELISDLRLQQSKAAAGDGTGSFGVHLENDSYVIFEGTSYDNSDASNFTVDLPSKLSLENILLNGGGNDIIFASPEGRTTQYGSFEIVSEEPAETRVISVNTLGLIE